MRIHTIELEGFQSWRESQKIDLTGLDLVAIVGPVHSGKSSLINAIEFALWGTSRTGLVSGVVNHDSRIARVKMTFEVGGDTYRVIRTRPRSGSGEVLLAVQDATQPSGWRELCEKSAKVADPKIVELIGMNEQVSSLTWMLRQNNYGAFCNLTPTDRRAALATAFGLDEFAVLADRAEIARKAAEKDAEKTSWNLDSVTSRIEEISSRIETQRPLKELDKKISTLTSSVDDLTLQIASSGPGPVAELNDLRAQHEAASAKFTADRNRLLTAQREAKSAHERESARHERAAAARDSISSATKEHDESKKLAEQSHERISAAVRQASEAREKAASADAASDALDVRIEDAQVRLDALRSSGEGHCSVCQSILDDVKVSTLSETTEGEIRALTAQRDELRELSRNQRRIAAEADENERLETDMAVRLDRRVASAAQLLASSRAMSSDLGDAKDAMDRAAKEIETIAAQIGELVEPVLDTDRLAHLEKMVAQSGDDPSAERDRLRAELSEVTAARADRAHDEKALAELEASLTRAQQESQIAATRLADIVTIRDAFRPAGIPARIIAGVVDELNTEANSVMDATDNDGLRVRVSTQKTTAKGSTTEAVMVYAINAASHQVEYSGLSGSEQFRVALAIRLGLARCIARRTGNPIRTIVVDEGWGNLDGPTRIAVAGVLTQLAGQFGVLTVSHVDDVKDSFSNIVSVESDSGTSRAQVLNI